MAKALFAEGIKEVKKGSKDGHTDQERQAASLFLSALMSVEAFRVTIFESLGLQVGEKSKLSCLSNFSFLTEEINGLQPEEANHRPNGLLYLQTTKFVWSALMVTRVSGVELKTDALAHCAEIAKQNHVNAILTVCDKFTARPSVLPVEIEKSTIGDLEIYHLPWGRIYTATKQILLTAQKLPDADRKRLSEFAAYMESETRCLDANSRMQPETSTIARLVTSGAMLDPFQSEVVNVVASWHDNLNFLGFKLREQINCDVAVNGVDKTVIQSEEQLNEDVIRFTLSNQLHGHFSIAKGAAEISLTVDLLRRTANYSLSLGANGDSGKSANRLTALLKKLKNSNPENLYIKANYDEKTPPKQASLEMVMNDPALLHRDPNDRLPESYEVLMVRDIASDLEAMELLVDQIDDGLLSFYENVARNFSGAAGQREKAPVTKTKPAVKAANENFDLSNAQSKAALEKTAFEKAEKAEDVEKAEKAEDIRDAVAPKFETMDLRDSEAIEEDFSANRLVEILGKLETFTRR